MFEFFTTEQKLLRKVIRSFVDEKIAPYADEWDRESKCPKELWPEFAKLGMIGCFVSEEQGGAGLGLTERTIIVEEIARHSAGLAISFMTNDIAIAIINSFGCDKLKNKFIPPMLKGELIGSFAVTESTGGSDFTNQKTTITQTDKTVTVSGQKCFITNWGIADFSIITGVTGQDKRGRNVITGVVIPGESEGFMWGRVEHKIGMKSSLTGDLILKNTEVPKFCKLGEDGSGKLIALNTIARYGRSAMTAIAVGILGQTLKDTVKFAKEREIYGKPLANLYTSVSIIAEIRSSFEAAHAVLYNSVSLSEDNPDYVPRISSAKLFCAEAAVSAAKKSIDMMGSYGLMSDYPQERYLRDALAVIPSGGTSHIMSLIAGNDIIRKSV